MLLAFINGAAVLGLSLMTRYPGGLFKVLSFKAHGKKRLFLRRPRSKPA